MLFVSQVTVAGFEPLLKFAYTSKLLFRKDNVIDIRNSASILGFRDLDKACLDFLIPKFSSINFPSPSLRKPCCKKKCKRRLSKEEASTNSDDVISDENEVKPAADSSSQEEVTWRCNKSVNSKMQIGNRAGAFTPEGEGTNDNLMQCPKYRRQLACEKIICEKSQNKPITVIKDTCNSPYTASSSITSNKHEPEVDHPGKVAEIHREADTLKRETNERQSEWEEKRKDIDIEDESNTNTASFRSNAVLGEGSSGLILYHCCLKTFGEGPVKTGSQGQFAMDITEDENIRSTGVLAPVSDHQKEVVKSDWKIAGEDMDSVWLEKEKGRQPAIMEEAAPLDKAKEKSTVEGEVAEHQAEGLGSGVCLSQLSFQDLDPGSSSDTQSGQAHNTSVECLTTHRPSKHIGCSFSHDLDQSKCLWKGAELSECEGASQSGVSSFNSGEDGDSETETEGDSESCGRERRAEQVSRCLWLLYITALRSFHLRDLGTCA